VIRQELELSVKKELEKILTTAPSHEFEHTKKDPDGFQKLFHRFLQEKGPSVDWGKIQRPPEDLIQPYEKIKARGLPDNISSVLNKLVVVKLSGGLGISMGCKGPKSLIDNLGATVDRYIFNHLMNPPNGKPCEFVIEVTNKTRADVKGETLTQYEGKLRLVEIAQVSKAHVDEFKSVSKFKIFNTNNSWISLAAVKRLQEQNAIDMEIIVNPKTGWRPERHSVRNCSRGCH
ncbi:hypothetical protein MC885_021597, partial [Smutsia gigantea]